MKFSVGTNWQDDLIPSVKRDSVEELYGRVASDFVGGGRPAYISANPSEKKVRSHIKQAHQNGMEFNYLLNTACIGNKEFTTSGRKKIYQLIDWIVSIEADAITVAIPYLLHLIKKRHPKMKVYISSFANVDTVQKARNWQELGADRITLSEFSLNRDFLLLRQIKKSVSCKIQLMANNSCIYDCPFAPYHSVITSHSSQSGHSSGGFLLDYCIINCKHNRIANPVNFIRAGWIRPEDIHFYENVGVDSMKLVDRTRGTGIMALIVEAYDKRRYDGNLMDLLPSLSRDSFFYGVNKIWRGFKYFLHPFSINPSSLYRFSKLDPKLHVYIDNRALDGFIDFFLERNCRYLSCSDCGYCQRVAERIVKIEPNYRQETLAKYKAALDVLI